MVNDILAEVLGAIAGQKRLTTKKRRAEGVAAAKGKRFGRPAMKTPEKKCNPFDPFTGIGMKGLFEKNEVTA